MKEGTMVRIERETAMKYGPATSCSFDIGVFACIIGVMGILSFVYLGIESRSIWARICSITVSYISTRGWERLIEKRRNAYTLQNRDDFFGAAVYKWSKYRKQESTREQRRAGIGLWA